MDRVKAQAQKVMDKTILITSASGFIAAHILTAFLEAGYKVRGTVRSEETANKVRKSHSKYANQLSFAIVPDIVPNRAFDEAVKGVDGVIHTASPFVMSVTDNEKDLLLPALEGTKNILAAFSSHAPQVHRAVITSSFASIVNIHKGNWPGHTNTEADWNPETCDVAKTADGATAYCASKTFAEQAAFDYVKDEKPNFSVSTICPPMVYGPVEPGAASTNFAEQAAFDYVKDEKPNFSVSTICPTMVYGPVEHGAASTKNLNTSSADIWRLMNGSEKEVPSNSFWAFCDVRDVATAHLKAYETPAAANERFFTTGGSYSCQMICDAIRKSCPEIKDRVPEGKPGSGLGAEVYGVDNSKAERVLGMKFRSLDECVADTARSLLALERSESKA